MICDLLSKSIYATGKKDGSLVAKAVSALQRFDAVGDFGELDGCLKRNLCPQGFPTRDQLGGHLNVASHFDFLRQAFQRIEIPEMPRPTKDRNLLGQSIAGNQEPPALLALAWCSPFSGMLVNSPTVLHSCTSQHEKYLEKNYKNGVLVGLLGVILEILSGPLALTHFDEEVIYSRYPIDGLLYAA